jgi:uncharacterized protein YndB with AHSA1/START domain
MANAGTLQVTAAGDKEIVLTRVFDAPRRLVFEAFTKPELLKRWLLGPPGREMVSCEAATGVGARYRYVWKHADGKSFGMGGVCREFLPPEKLVCTELMDGYPSESFVTTIFTEQAGKTTMRTTAVYESREVRDTVLKSGMERGAGASYDRLEEMLKELEKSSKKP